MVQTGLATSLLRNGLREPCLCPLVYCCICLLTLCFFGLLQAVVSITLRFKTTAKQVFKATVGQPKRQANRFCFNPADNFFLLRVFARHGILTLLFSFYFILQMKSEVCEHQNKGNKNTILRRKYIHILNVPFIGYNQHSFYLVHFKIYYSFCNFNILINLNTLFVINKEFYSGFFFFLVIIVPTSLANLYTL